MKKMCYMMIGPHSTQFPRRPIQHSISARFLMRMSLENRYVDCRNSFANATVILMRAHRSPTACHTLR